MASAAPPAPRPPPASPPPLRNRPIAMSSFPTPGTETTGPPGNPPARPSPASTPPTPPRAAPPPPVFDRQTPARTPVRPAADHDHWSSSQSSIFLPLPVLRGRAGVGASPHANP